MMKPLDIMSNYYNPQSEAWHILYTHSRSVADKALALARMHPEMNLDLDFIEAAALLHDIGIYKCNAPDIYCTGTFDYICHGYLGADMMRAAGYPRHALVCERHTGSGITLAEIESRDLPLPHREMVPVSTEEKLICFADKFYSKTKLDKEKSIDKIRKSLSKYGNDAVLRFDQLCKLFLG